MEPSPAGSGFWLQPNPWVGGGCRQRRRKKSINLPKLENTGIGSISSLCDGKSARIGGTKEPRWPCLTQGSGASKPAPGWADV